MMERDGARLQLESTVAFWKDRVDEAAAEEEGGRAST